MKKIRECPPLNPEQRLSPYCESFLVDFFRRREPASKKIEQWPPDFRLPKRDLLQILALAEGGFYREKIGGPTSRLLLLYLSNLTHNRKLLNAVNPVIEALRARKIPVLALKGLALCEGYYRDYGARFMEDIDLLVPKGQAEDALRIVFNLGWKPGVARTSLEKRNAPEQDMRFGHAIGFVSPQQQKLDLHWNLLSDSLSDTWTEHFWSTSLEVEGKSFRVLDSTSQLFHICVHGSSVWGGKSTVYWSVDAARILRDPLSPIDWAKFVECARAADLSLRVRASLTYLEELFALATLVEPLKRLKATPVSWFEFREYKLRASRTLTKNQQGWLYFFSAAWRSGFFAFPKLFTSLPDYISRRLGARHVWQLPYLLPVRIVQRFFRSFSLRT